MRNRACLSQETENVRHEKQRNSQEIENVLHEKQRNSQEIENGVNRKQRISTISREILNENLNTC